MRALLVALLCSVHIVVGFEQQPDDEWSAGLYEMLDLQHIAGIEQNDEVQLIRSTGNDDAQPIRSTGNDEVQPIRSTDEDILVDYMLFTRDDLNNYTTVSPDDVNSFQNLDNSKELKVVIHGWRNAFDSPLGEILKEAYLANIDVNVLVVDWSSKSMNNYVRSRMSVSRIGREVARLMDTLVRNGLSLDKIHLIGHSLGAHVAGVAGLRMRTGQVARITGLDPALPMFSAAETDLLKPESAKFVDVIHTCGYVLGFMSPLGHADFYPNKGTPAQPGCGFDYDGSCSHARAYEFFADSLTSNTMLAVHCKDSFEYDRSKCSSGNVIPMGEYTPSTANGFYVLRTNRRAPYGVGTPRL